MILTKYGTIKDGNCDKIHRARFDREQGSIFFLILMTKRKCFSSKLGWFRVTKIPKDDALKLTKEAKRNGNFEIGIHRFRQDVTTQLLKTKKKFRWKWMEKWVVQIASFELGFHAENPLSIITPGSKCGFGLVSPHKDFIYQQKKKDNYFKEGESK